MTQQETLATEFIALLEARNFPGDLEPQAYLHQAYQIVSALTRAILQADATYHGGGMGPHLERLGKPSYPLYLLLQFSMESAAAEAAVAPPESVE